MVRFAMQKKDWFLSGCSFLAAKIEKKKEKKKKRNNRSKEKPRVVVVLSMHVCKGGWDAC